MPIHPFFGDFYKVLEILNLFHAFHFTTDQAIEMKKLASYHEAPLGK